MSVSNIGAQEAAADSVIQDTSAVIPDADTTITSDNPVRDTLPEDTLTAVPDTLPPDTSVAVPDTTVVDTPWQGPEKKKGSFGVLKLRDKDIQHPASKIHRRKKISRQRLDRMQIQKVPAVQGDPIRAINTLPGITTQSDASVRPYVRGGKADETRVFWDGLPLMQPYHFGGLYSLFNVESIEDVTIYSGAFPVEGNNAMSGAIFLRSRPAPLDSFKLYSDLSLLRGNFYAGAPIIKNKLGVYFSYQAFWYDWFYNRTLDVIDWTTDDESFTRYKEDFEKYIDLPNFRDLQFGTAYRVNQDATASYVGLISQDIFSNMWTRNAYYVDGDEVSPEFYQRHLFFSNEPARTRNIRNILDTLAIIRVNNDIHNLNLKWNLGQHWVLENSTAVQLQEWHVEFFAGDEWEDNSESLDEFEGQRLRNSEGLKFHLDRQLWNYKTRLGFYGIKDHEISTGFTYDYLEEEFDADMVRVLFELLYNGNTDLLASLGHYGTDGFAITTSTPGSDPNLSYLNRLIDQINFQHQGKVWASYYGGYLEDTWNISKKQRLISGVRVEYEENSQDFFPSPRLSYFYNISKTDEITFATGLYSQNDIPFFIRNEYGYLSSEKSAHVNSEWTHHFSDSYRLELQNYYKYYWDLIMPDLYNTRELEWGNDGIGQHDSLSFSNLSPAAQKYFIDLHGERQFQYDNTGIGHALGSELSFFYDPITSWNGWISAEISKSNRRDNKGDNWYPFRYHRPWIINWVNYFKFPGGKYEMAVRARYAAGLPYTEFKSDFNLNSDTLLYIGPRNDERYLSYQRVDLRLTRNGKIRGHPIQFYFAVWNLFNRPNFLLRDRETEEVKFFNYNIPIPILFLGTTFRW